jgi:hypothetical protein
MRFRSILQGDFDKSPWLTPVPIALYNGNRQDTTGNCDMDAGENEIRLEKPATALRRGWTTGACATAATKAALTALLTGEFPDPVEITLPRGETRALRLRAKPSAAIMQWRASSRMPATIRTSPTAHS